MGEILISAIWVFAVFAVGFVFGLILATKDDCMKAFRAGLKTSDTEKAYLQGFHDCQDVYQKLSEQSLKDGIL